MLDMRMTAIWLLFCSLFVVLDVIYGGTFQTRPGQTTEGLRPQGQLSPKERATLNKRLDGFKQRYQTLDRRYKELEREMSNLRSDMDTTIARERSREGTGLKDCLDACQTEYDKCLQTADKAICTAQATACVLNCALDSVGRTDTVTPTLQVDPSLEFQR
jgi:hypothetical protein